MVALIALFSLFLTLQSSSPAGAQTFTSIPLDQVVRKDETVSLSCTATNVIVIGWNRDRRVVKKDARHKLSVTKPTTNTLTSELTIHSIKESDAGTYHCQGYSDDGSPTLSSTFKLQLATAPVIERYTGPFYANQSATATLTCRASGLPLPKLTWSRNGLKLKDQADTLVLTYTMKYVTKGDAGSYECLAENVAGSDKKTLQVVVYYPPRISSTSSSPLLLGMGTTSTLRCDATGLPTPTVSWSFKSAAIASNATSSGSSVLLYKVKPNDGGLYTCVASNLLGKDSSQINVIIQGPPGIPFKPVPVKATSTSIFLRLQPGSDGDSPITGYKLDYAEINDTYWYRVHVSVAALTEAGEQGYELTNLEPRTPYEFVLKAVNKYGRSDFTDPTDPYWTLPAPPKAPKNVKVKAKGSTVNVTWKAPDFDSSMGTVLGYIVLHRYLGASQFGSDEVDIDMVQFAIENLGRGVTYEVGVAARNRYSRSPNDKIKFILVNTTATVPGRPNNCVATAVSHSSIELTWHKPLDNGGSTVTGYEVQYASQTNKDDWKQVSGSPTSLLRLIVSKLMSGTSYKFQVAAVNSEGKGKPTTFSGQTISQDAPPKPSPVHFLAITGSSIHVAWSPPSGERANEVTSYKLQYRKAGEGAWYFASSFLPARLHNIKLLDLEPETRYDFRLITSNNGLDSAASDISSVNTSAPGETTAILPPQIMSTRATSFLVTWSVTKEVEATGFRVQYRVLGGEWRDRVSHSSSTRQLRITSLRPNTTYEVRVVALQGQVPGVQSYIVESRTAASEYGSSANKSGNGDTIMIIIIGAACGVAILIAIVIVCLCCRVHPGAKPSDESESVTSEFIQGNFQRTDNLNTGSTAEGRANQPGECTAPANSLPRPTTTASLLAYTSSFSSVHHNKRSEPQSHATSDLVTTSMLQQQQSQQSVALDGSFVGQSGKTSRVPSAIVSPNNAAAPKSSTNGSEENLPPYNGLELEVTLPAQQTDTVDETRPESAVSTQQNGDVPSSSPSETEKPEILSTTSKNTLDQEVVVPVTPAVSQVDPPSCLSPAEMDRSSQDRSLSAVQEEVGRVSKEKSMSPQPESIHSHHSQETGNASGNTAGSHPSVVTGTSMTSSTATSSAVVTGTPHQQAYQNVPGMVSHVRPGSSAGSSRRHRHHRRHRSRSRTHSPGQPRRSSRRHSPASSTNLSRQGQTLGTPGVPLQGMSSPIHMKTFMSPVPSQHSSTVSSHGARKDPSGITVVSPTQHTVV